ncbi:MAG: glycosyltransferase family 1 protein, partial [Chloroflexi bacterium]
MVGTVSRLAPEKNVALFLTAAQALARTRPDVKFLVVGDGPERASLQAQFQDANIAFVGQRADVPRLLQICDVFVLASNTEGFSVALVEAMAAGRAIVAT